MANVGSDIESSRSSDSSDEAEGDGPPIAVVPLSIVHVGELSGTKLAPKGSLSVF